MMYKKIVYADKEHTVICATNDDGSIVIIEPTSGENWDKAKAGQFGKVAPYTPAPRPSARAELQAERSLMKCTAAQFEWALEDLGRLDEFQENASRRALIIVRRETHVSRKGAVLAVLKKMMKAAEIDGFFRTAMATIVE